MTTLRMCGWGDEGAAYEHWNCTVDWQAFSRHKDTV